MSGESSPELKAEIGHVLLIDIVGYSKLLITEQGELLETLKQLVHETEPVRLARSERDLIRLPTGDGMALVFRNNSEAPLECALQLGAGVRQHPVLQLRMGIHSGPIREVRDVNERINLAGAGIDVAQRVMDCGDAGHILVSKRVADDLAPYPRWNAQLHDLGEAVVKHGARVHLFNLYSKEAGNPATPSKLQKQTAPALSGDRSGSRWLALALAGLVLLSLGGGLWWFATRPGRSAAKPTATTQSAPAVPEKSIAVLPFENRSEQKANEFFADGVQDEILTNLARIADLKVISRTSVMQYKSGARRNLREIGHQLGVAHLVEGSVQRAGGKVRVNAQLIDARTDAHLWGQTYDRNLADVFAIQSEIATAIAVQLQAKLSPSEKTAIARPPTSDVAAFDYYARARNLLLNTTFGSARVPNVREAIELLQQAVTRDPNFFAAYCQLAYAHDWLYLSGADHTARRLTAAEEAIQAAFRLRPDAGEAHLARAENLYRGYLDYDAALAELEIARRKLPNNSRVLELAGYINRRRGKNEEGLRKLEGALDLDPRNILLLQQMAGSYLNLRRYPETAAALDRVLEIAPDNTAARSFRAFVDLDWKADTEPLHQVTQSILAANPGAITTIADLVLGCALAERDAATAQRALAALGENTFGGDAVGLSRSFGEGLVARMTGDEAKAHAAFTAARLQQEKVVQAQPDYGPALSVLGLIDAGLGRKEEALSEGRRAVELLPFEKDSINGWHMIEYLAIIAAWVGENDLAIEQLTRAIELPGGGWTSYGALKLLPFWDPLRSDPRFKKILADLAPKETKS
ncbi:MAG: hypothetical protein H0W20_12670 [Chthoniobacterales bacterium]|nr:hypothetical protein [Chthoniobacterales bacterium]